MIKLQYLNRYKNLLYHIVTILIYQYLHPMKNYTSLLFYALAVLMLTQTQCLLGPYSFNRTCVICDECKASPNGTICLVVKGGPYDGTRWEEENTCVNETMCEKRYPEQIYISNLSNCEPFNISCFRSDRYPGDIRFQYCSRDEKLCFFDPNYEHTKLIAIIAVIAAIVIVVLIVLVLVYRFCWGGKKKFDTSEKFQVFNEG